MYTWPKGIFVAATVLTAGCAGTIEDPGGGPGTGTGTTGSGTGTTGSGTGTTGSGTGTTGSGNGATGSGTGTTGSGTGTTGSGTGTTGSGTGTTGSGTGTTGSGTGTTGTGTGTTGTGTTPACTPGIAPTSQLPRLNHAQYDNTIRDLFGVTTDASTLLAPDGPGSVDQRAWDGYLAAAESLAPQVISNATIKAKVIPCTPSGDGAACAAQLISTFGAKAFRRPLTADETTRFTKLYTDRATLTATGTFDEAAQLIVKAFLVSPSFLTRAETAEVVDGDHMVLNAYEVASRLSYMLWGTMPDDTLFAAAKAGTLATAEQILAQAQRMMMDAKARTRVSAFHESYALMGPATRWSDVAHDAALFPAFKQSMVPALSDSTKKFFDYVTFDLGGTFQDLLTKPVAFVNKDLAPVYGLDASKYGTDLVKADLDPAQRAGVFTQAGFLASYSSFNRTSPILRGAFLQKQILCAQIGSPPADALNTPVPTDPNLVTNRQRVDAQTAGGTCVGCHHTTVNPTGFAMESYNSIGSWQTAEKDTNAPIDASADVLIGATAVKVNGPVELMAKIAASPEAQRCYAQRMVESAYERVLAAQDACTVQNMAAKVAAGGYTVQNMVTDLTQSPSFRNRVKEAP